MNDFQKTLRDNGIFLVTTQSIDEGAMELIFKLMEFSASNPDSKIRLYISSTGTNYSNALAIYDCLKSLKNHISVTCIGLVSGFAPLLISVADKNERYALKHTEFSLKQPYGYIGAGANQQTEVLIASEEAKLQRETYESLLAEELKIKKDKIHNDLEKGLSLNADEAKTYGLIDKVI